MSDFDSFANSPKTGVVDPTAPSQEQASPGSNRDSLNLDDFEKVEADQLPSATQNPKKADPTWSADVQTDLLSSAPPPPAASILADLSPPSPPVSQAADFLAAEADKFLMSDEKDTKAVSDPTFDPFSFTSPPPPVVSAPVVEPPTLETFAAPDSFASKSPVAPKMDLTPEPFPEPTIDFSKSAQKLEAGLGFFDDKLTTQDTTPRDPSPDPFTKREPSPAPRDPTPTPPPREPTPPPKAPTPPPREATPPPKAPTPPPREPTPPPKAPTPPPREPTPPPKAPTPPPREPTPPPKAPTPPPREPTPPPREPTPPPKAPTPTPPPKSVTPPPQLVEVEQPVQEAKVTTGRKYVVSESTKKNFAVFNPLVDLIYWRDVKKTGVAFGSVMMILISLAYLSLITVVAYSSLTILSATITFRIYKNIMQAVQKSQDGHPFKDFLDMDTNLPTEKVHEATDVIVSQLNSTVSELKRLFLVEDLVDSVKFGCLLWCLTYLGSWFNGLTLVILSVVALFSLPKVYEQNQSQIDQYVGLVRSQVNDIMSKVKAALPIGNKEKAQ